MLFENLLQSHVKDKFSFAIVCDIYERQDVIATSKEAYLKLICFVTHSTDEQGWLKFTVTHMEGGAKILFI